jgi:hypothetical protein
MNQNNSTFGRHRSPRQLRNQACPRSRRPIDARRRMTVPSQSLPIEWLPRQRDPGRLITDPQIPYALNTSTPSPASSSSPCTLITPTCLHPEGQMRPPVSHHACIGLSPPNGFRSPEMCGNSCTPVHTAIPLSNMRKQKSTSMPIYHGTLEHQIDFWSESDELSMQYAPSSYPQPPPSPPPIFISSQHRGIRDNNSVQQQQAAYPKQTIPNLPIPLENHHSAHHHIAASTLYPTSVSQPAVAPSTHTRNQQPYPILYQPQPIRPIPLIPLSDLSPSHDATLQDPSVSHPPTEHASLHQSYHHQQGWHPHPHPQPQLVTSAHPDKTDILPQSSLLFQPAPDSVRFSFTNVNDAQNNNTYHITSVNDGAPDGFSRVYT